MKKSILWVLLAILCMSSVYSQTIINNIDKSSNFTIGRYDKYNDIVYGDFNLYYNNSAQLYVFNEDGNEIYDEISWNSSDDSIVSVDDSGCVYAKGTGTADITATSADSSDTITITVLEGININIGRKIYDEEINISYDDFELNKGYLEKLYIFNDVQEEINNKISWNSSDKNVVLVDKSGFVFAKGIGTAIITATYKGSSDTITITVPSIPVTNVNLNKTTLNIERGKKSLLIATILPVNATNKAVTWTSSDTNIATVTEYGIVKAIANGTATITVTTVDGNKVATCEVTVTDPVIKVKSVKLDKTSLSLVKDNTAQLTATILPTNATNKTVTWRSTNTKVATVSTDGLVTGITKGYTYIVVTTTDGKKTATCKVKVTEPIVNVTSVTVTPTTLSLAKGKKSTLTATVLPENATNKAVTWTSSDTNIATVTEYGIVKAIANGTATITVTTIDGNKLATCEVTVTDPVIKVKSVKLDKTSLSLVKDNTAQLTATVLPTNATNKTVTWRSTNTKVATVSTDGLVTGIAKGYTYIVVTTTDGKKTATCKVKVTEPIVNVTSVTVTPTTLSLAKGEKSTLTATVLPENATNKKVTWKSNNSRVAIVTLSGVVIGISKGTATITVTTIDGKKTATCIVTVTEPVVSVTSVKLSKKSLSLKKGKKSILTAIVLPINATNKAVTWTSSDTNIVTVSSKGFVKAIAKGTATITVTTVDGKKTATCKVTVK